MAAIFMAGCNDWVWGQICKLPYVSGSVSCAPPPVAVSSSCYLMMVHFFTGFFSFPKSIFMSVVVGVAYARNFAGQAFCQLPGVHCQPPPPPKVEPTTVQLVVETVRRACADAIAAGHDFVLNTYFGKFVVLLLLFGALKFIIGFAAMAWFPCAEKDDREMSEERHREKPRAHATIEFDE